MYCIVVTKEAKKEKREQFLTSLGTCKHKTRQITKPQQLQSEEDRHPEADPSFAIVIAIHVSGSPGYPHGDQRDGHEDEIGEEGTHPVSSTNVMFTEEG